MSFHSYKNVKVLINTGVYFCQNASISENSNIAASYDLEGKYSNNYVAEDGIGGNLRISYILTGNDLLTNNIVNETSIISGNFGGLNFQSGYLRSYSFGLEPNSPVIVNAEIVFFDSILGNLSPTYATAPELPCLNVSDVRILNLTGENIGTIRNVTSLNYNYNVDIQSQYNIGQTIPERVVFGPKEIGVEIISDETNAFLSVSGITATVRASLIHPENTGIFQNFDCRGVLFQKDFSSSANNILVNKLAIKQNSFIDFTSSDLSAFYLPIIYSFAPTSGYYGTGVTITGENFNDVDFVSYNGTNGDVFDYNFQIVNNNRITSTIPSGTITGPIRLTAQENIITSTGVFFITGTNIIVRRIIPITGYIDSDITISGDNFYEISRVLFNQNQTALFNRISKNLIQATVPDHASWGYINIISDLFNLSGISDTKFVPFPDILGFSPGSGFMNDFILVSGAAFSGVTGASINNLTGAFSITNNTGISIQIPSGNTRGFVRLLGQSGVSALSTQEFFPYSLITGISPGSGRFGTLINVSGINFIPEILYNFGSDKYAVAFQGDVTGYFQRLSNILLTGAVPSGAKNGIINIYSQNSEEYPSNISFIVRNDPPIFDYFSPISGKRLDYISVIGQNFTNLYNIIITGLSTGSNLGSNFNVSSTEDYLNFQIPNTLTGGNYDIRISGLEGLITGSGLYVMENPYISGFTPLSGGIGSVLTLTGLQIYPYLTNIWIDGSGTVASITVGSQDYNNNTIQFSIPGGISSGDHKIIVYNSVSSGSGIVPFKLIPLAMGNLFSPNTGSWGDFISLSGSDLNLVTGLSISNTGITNFSIINSTGITFQIPNNASIDFVRLNNFAGTSYTNNQLTILSPFPIISGFIGQNSYYGSGIIMSGRYFNIIQEIHFSGASSGYISISNFTTINETGINFVVPGGIKNGLIRVVSNRGFSYSPYILSIISGAQIGSISNYMGVFKDQIILSGNFLSGSLAYFPNLTGGLVLADSIIRVQETGIYFSVPSGIISGPIKVRSRNDVYVTDTGDYIVLPTISGINSVSISSGGYLQITGINVNTSDLITSLGISGHNGIFYDIANSSEFSGSYHTGYSMINLRINNSFVGSGKLFLISENDTNLDFNNFIDSLSYNKKNSIVFNTPITISQPNPILTYISKTGGNDLTIITLSGDNLISVNSIVLNIGIESGTGIQTSTGNNSLQFTLPSNFPSGTGTLFVSNLFGQTQTGRFKYLQRLYGSGISPSVGRTGDAWIISGSGLLGVDSVYIGNFSNNFSGGYYQNSYTLSGVLTGNYSCCGETVYITLRNLAEDFIF